jgi:methylenetetrahydrofolate dehydrogenase (NADP+)/methenyltetrahydrofolate cyclohydrolase
LLFTSLGYNYRVTVDGKKIAGEIVESLARERATLPVVVKLGVLMSRGDLATDSFVRIKERTAQKLDVVVVREELNLEAGTKTALQALERLCASTDGVIVQLPLPERTDTDAVLAALPGEKDVDGIGKNATPLVRPPVVEAIAEVFSRAGVAAANKWAVVVGAGRLVGLPAAQFLRSLGAEVSVITNTHGTLAELEDADIVVLGAGSSGLVRPEMLKEGVVLIDAGTSEAGGRMVGDAIPECANKASVFTPVPGGVGPIAVAMIFKNLFALVRQGNR